MGQTHPASQWKGYDHALLNDKEVQTIMIDDPNRLKNEDGIFTSTNIVRNMLAKGLKNDEFPGFRVDPTYTEEKGDNEVSGIDVVGGRVPLKTKGRLSTGWAVWKYVSTLPENKDKKCFGTRPYTSEEKNFDPEERGTYEWETYSSCYEQTVQVGLGLRYGLRKLGYELPDQSNIGICSRNRVEWMLTHLGNWSQGYRTVALYDTLGFESVKYITNHAEMPVIFVEKAKLQTVFEAVRACAQDPESDLKLKFIIQFDTQKRYNNLHENIEDADRTTATELGLTLIGFSELSTGALVKQLQDENKEENYSFTEANCPQPKDLAYVMYTSGTTGDPKGVMLSHRAFACVVGSTARSFISMPNLQGVPWIHVSYLTLAHSFESAVIVGILSQSGEVAFYQGNIKKIGDDWREIKPTLVFGVPRVYNKAHDKVMAGMEAATGIKKLIASKAKQKSFDEVRRGRRSQVFDKLVWDKVAPKLGYENCRLIASGAAPLSPAVAEFLRVACKQAAVVQGYGLTETTAVSFFTGLEDRNLGHVGCPVDNVEYRLVDVQDKEYFVEPRTEEDKAAQKNGTFYPKGEIQMRGPTMMDGYFKNPEATAKTLLEGGWISTGDIGRLNPNGTLSIIDRAKAIFKLERGEYISPEKVEIAYGRSSAVGQVFVTGNSNLELPVALIVPDGQWLQVQFTTRKGQKVDGCNKALDSDWSDADNNLVLASAEWVARINSISIKNEEWIRYAVKADIASMMDELKEELRHEERIADLDVVVELDEMLQGFSVEKNTLTPSFKLKRRIIERVYADKLQAMYDKMNAAKKAKAAQSGASSSQPAAAAPAQAESKEDAPVTTETNNDSNDAAPAVEEEAPATTTTEDAPADSGDAPAEDAAATTEDAPAAPTDE